jgi:hypothetical protein
MGLKKLRLKIQRVSLQFYRKSQFEAKTDINYVFFCHKAHIPDQLHIIVSYISSYGFQKFHILVENSKGLAFGFTKNHQFAVNID